MKKYLTVRNIIYTVLIILVGMQFLRIDMTNPPVDRSQELASITPLPEEIHNMLKVACYDCHSNETSYPWYSHVAPFSWIIADHIMVGRDELNFSEWGTYPVKKQDHKLEEMMEEVEEGEMPLKGYVMLHSKANMTAEQKETLIAWIRNYREALGVPEE